jgi:2-polyprenyl-6-methoxyphenol hydroxylase-like FAD-dependent oxidoreductase
MARVLVLGGGVIGLSTAMMLARQRHDVTVLERDNDPVPSSPDEAWHTWERRGVAQFRQPHFLQAAARHLLDAYLPDVKRELVDAGCVTFDVSTLIPPSIADRGRRAGDERFVTVTGRRVTIEYAVARAAERAIPIRRGVSVVELLTGPHAANGVPHVTGVRTLDGQEITADLVVDAMGRRSKIPDWLEAIGARRPIDEAEESGFLYYTRFFRSRTTELPPCRSGLLTHFHSFSLLTLPGDSHTWSTTVFVFSGDPVMKSLRDVDRWTALVAACPLHAHWLDGEPISSVLPMGGVADRYRRFVVDGVPVAAGIVSVGDSWACTNPVGGRGISMGLMHAVGTVEVVQKHLNDPLALALAHDDMTEARVTPWYRNTVEFDRKRTAQIRAVVQGQTVARANDPADLLPTAMMYDADLFRAGAEIFSLLALPQQVLARPGVADRIMGLAASHPAMVSQGPTRDDVIHILA